MSVTLSAPRFSTPGDVKNSEGLLLPRLGSLRDRRTWLLLAGLSMAACGQHASCGQSTSPARTINIGWDAPATTPKGYRILIDGQVVLSIAPPPVDPACKCLNTNVPLPAGQHTVAVVAYNEFGDSAPSAVAVVK